MLISPSRPGQTFKKTNMNKKNSNERDCSDLPRVSKQLLEPILTRDPSWTFGGSFGYWQSWISPTVCGKSTLHLLQHIVGDVLDEPVEGFTFQTLLEFKLRGDISHAGVLGRRLPGLRQFHCHFGQHIVQSSQSNFDLESQSNIFATDWKRLKHKYDTLCRKTFCTPRPSTPLSLSCSWLWWWGPWPSWSSHLQTNNEFVLFTVLNSGPHQNYRA